MNKLLTYIILQPTFNDGEAKQLVGEWLNKLLDYTLWLIPLTAMLYIGINYIMWLMKDENEREQRPFWTKTFSKIVFGTIVVELVQAIFKIFGLV